MDEATENKKNSSPVVINSDEVLQFALSWDGKNVDIVDLRTVDEYTKGHLSNSACLPSDCLFDRVPELPPKGAVLQLIGSNETDLQTSEIGLLDRGYTVDQKILWTEKIQEILSSKGILSTGYSNMGALWTASPCLTEYIQFIESALLQGTVKSLNEAVAIDLACGGGRDVVFLALRNWGRVIGIDYLSYQLEKTRQLGKTHQIEEKRIETIERDLEQLGLPIQEFPSTFHLVTIARYLHRPHFPELKQLIAVGGFLVFHTFMKGCESSSVGRPRRPQFLLNHNELAENFNPSTGFEIISDKIVNIHDGRPTSFFVARRI